MSATVERRLGRPPAANSAETRARVMATARRLFASYGYDATTNKVIAAEAGITTGAIYHYFASKGDLYVAVFEEVQELVFGEFEKAVAAHDGFGDRLVAMLERAAGINAHDRSVAGFLVAVPTEVQRHPDLADRIAPLNRGQPFFGRLVDDAVARDEIDPSVPAAAVADMVYAVTAGLARFANEAENPHRLTAATAAVVALIRGTLVRVP